MLWKSPDAGAAATVEDHERAGTYDGKLERRPGLWKTREEDRTNMPLKFEQRTITPKQAEEMYQGAERVAVGIWRDRHGDIHFSIPELLAFVQLEDTPENREALVEILKDVHAERGPAGTTMIRNDLES